jgi:GNAT superfamily N-acetyltransferase
MLLGSMAAGMHDETSDYDIHVIFSDSALAARPTLRDFTLRLDRKCDLWVSSLSEFRALNRESPDAREYLSALYVLDDKGILAARVEQLIHYPSDEAEHIVRARLDGYYDGLYRSLKCFRHGFSFGGYQMAARSMEFLVETLWAANGLIPPFVNRAPHLLGTLSRLPCPTDDLRAGMEKIARCADVGTQIELFRRVAPFMAETGREGVLEAWGGVLDDEIARHAVEVRRAPADSAEARVLLRELSDTLAAMTGASGEAGFSPDNVAGPRAAFAIAYQYGAPAGCGAIRPLDEDTAELKRMYARRGGRGVGKSLLAFLETEAARLGYRAMALETRRVNEKAVRFYLANGYGICENYGRYAGRAEAVCFRKEL